MTDFKVGDVVAIIFQPWSKVIIKKISGNKAYVWAWMDYGIIGRFFPLTVRAVPLALLTEYKEDRLDCAVAPGEIFPKPPVSDPVAPEVQPL